MEIMQVRGGSQNHRSMEKKILTFLMAALLIFSLAACGSITQQTENSLMQNDKIESTEKNLSDTEPVTETAQPDISESSEPADTASNGKTLVVYFSWSTSGNTEKMATCIQRQTGADILELVPAKPYPADYNETGDAAKAERDENAADANVHDGLFVQADDTDGIMGYLKENEFGK